MMGAIIAILWLIYLLYAFLLVYAGFTYRKPTQQKSGNGIPGLSIVIPFRNERRNLSVFLKRFSELQTHGIKVEVLLIDDHSHDGFIINQEDYSLLDLKVHHLSPKESGKKRALDVGIDQATHSWILTMDADVTPDQGLFESLATADSSGYQMMISTISPEKRKGWVLNFFDLEYVSLQAAGAVSAKLGAPVLSSGACLLFRKEAYLETRALRDDWHLPSGDDIFLMIAISKRFGADGIGVLNSGLPVARTRFPSRFSELFRQRQRWISKTPSVKSFKVNFLAWLILLLNAIFYPVVIYGLISESSALISIAGIKIVFESFFFLAILGPFSRRDLIPFTLVSQFIYPIYLSSLVLTTALKGNNHSWKPYASR